MRNSYPFLDLAQTLRNSATRVHLQEMTGADVAPRTSQRIRVQCKHNGNAFDIVSLIHEDDFTLLFIDWHNVFLRMTVEPEQDTLPVEAVVGDLAVRLFLKPDQPQFKHAPSLSHLKAPLRQLETLHTTFG